MNRISIFILLAAGLSFGNAGAQSAGAPTAERSPVTNSGPQSRADAKVSARPSGKASATGNPVGQTAEAGAIGTDKAAAAGQRRAQTRDARRPSKEGGAKPRATQGGTPN